MLSYLFKNYFYPIATLSGSIVGVGFLSLPYITLQVGMWPMLFYFIILTVFVICIHLMFAQVCLKTPDFKRWPGFVEFYFGKWAKRAIAVPMIMGSFGILLVYLIIGSSFLANLLNYSLGQNSLMYVVLYFLVVSTVIYFGINIVSKFEFWALLLLLTALAIIFMKGFAQINVNNIFALQGGFNISNAFLPYGAIMFSLWGTGLIPEVEEMVRGKKRSLKKIVILGTLIPAAVYLMFIFLVLSISGVHTTDSALIGLKNYLGQGIISIALFIGILTTFTAFIAQGLLLKKVFMYDMKLKPSIAWVFTCFVPLILLLLGLHSFIGIISFVGGALLGIDGILILLMYKKNGGKSAVIYPFILFFLIVIVYSIIYFIS